LVSRPNVFDLVLVHPEIPPNTGNVIRLAANTGARLHLIEPLGFSLSDAQLRRAGLDYHEYASVKVHAGWTAFLQFRAPDPKRLFAITTRGTQRHDQIGYQTDDVLIFGCETAGLPADLLATIAPAQRLRLPMRAGNRSLNLANAVAICTYEAWRQLGWEGSNTAGSSG
jgi:tRNA (cytidine/uridine-2'-O-)-methyltransferase